MGKKIELGKAYVQIVPSADGITDSVKKALGDGGATGKGFGASLGGGIAKGIGAAAGAVATGVGVAAAGVTALSKAAFESYAETEQLVGGVETLFGTGGKNVEEYAESVGLTVAEASGKYNELMDAQKKVLADARNAYEESGLSYNEYMETVTGFSASLIQSLEGDTKQAADVANMAIIDMSDNANKMGSDMTSIQNAYQGFAKQNYTMLDNLKLGYGGTKQEMQRLLEDAGKLANQEFNLDSYADVINAIHVIQKNMGIAGTTSEEAATTIQGSIGMTKAAFDNLVAGLGDETADIGGLTENLVDSALLVVENSIPVIERILPAIVVALSGLIDKLLPVLPGLIQELLPGLLDASKALVQGLIDALPDLISLIMESVNQSIDMIPFILEQLPTIIEAVMQIITEVINALTEAFPELMPVIVDTVLQIANVLIDNAPMLITAALMLMVALADGLVGSRDQIIEKLPEIIGSITSCLIELAPELLVAAIEIIGTLTLGMIKEIPNMIAQLPKIVDAICDSFTSVDWGQIGKNIIDGIKNGLLNKLGDLKAAASNAASSILGTFKKDYDIHSPSRVFRDEIGKNLALGIEEGFTGTMNEVSATIGTSVDLTSALTEKTGDVPKRNISDGKNRNDELVVTVKLETDDDEIFKRVTVKSKEFKERNGRPAFA